MSHTDKLQLQFHNSVHKFVLPDQFVTMKIISLYSKFIKADLSLFNIRSDFLKSTFKKKINLEIFHNLKKYPVYVIETNK